MTNKLSKRDKQIFTYLSIFITNAKQFIIKYITDNIKNK